MRLLHISDLHLGRSLHGMPLLEDQRYALLEILKMCDEHEPDGLLIAGDVFDRGVPPEDAVQLLDWFIYEVAVARKVPVFLIPGNHDSADRIGVNSRLLRSKGLTIFGKLEESFQGQRLEARSGLKSQMRDASSAVECMIYGLPFSEPGYVGEFLGDETLRTHDLAAKAMTARIRAEHLKTADLPSVLLAHAFVAGGEESQDSERPLAVGGSSNVDPAAFADFSYVALGHLHKPQTAGAEHIRYSGSLLAYSKSEAGHVKGATLIDIDVAGKAKTRFLELHPKRALRALRGTLDALLASAEAESARDREAFVIVTLLDAAPVYDALGKLRGLYPNLLHIGREALFSPEHLPHASGAPSAPPRDVYATFAQFFMDTTSTELSGLELEELKAALAARAKAEAGAAAGVP